MRQALQFDFIRFGLVGLSGFAINFLLLTILFRLLGMPIFIAQLISGEIALFNNFILHDRWTYRRNNVSKSLTQLLIQFHATTWVAILGSALLVSFFVGMVHLTYLVALIISSTVALAWNFCTSKFYVWKHEHTAAKKEDS